jgi:hypothetical protein
LILKFTNIEGVIMKIKSNIKAGGNDGWGNHNEKMASDNKNRFEQKKSFAKKLRLAKETIRELKDGDLKAVAGGRPWSGGHTCSPTDNCI